MKVKIGNNYSKLQYIPSGVPWRSVSVSLPPLIFINDSLNEIKI